MTVAPAPERTLAPFGRRRAGVVANDEVGAYRLVWVEDPEGPRDPRPGQFYMLAAVAGWGGHDGRPFLPRAFSFARAGGGELGFLLEVTGPGTARLAELRRGEELWLTGPLGRGFRDPAERPLLVGGGIGVAPVLALSHELAPDVRVLVGFRSAAHAEARHLLAGGCALVTDDGSAGRAGLVTELLEEELDSGEAEALACGPAPMLEAVRALCSERGVPAQLALEAGMACGYGACYGCVVPTRAGYVRLCLDGPVLRAADLEAVPAW